MPNDPSAPEQFSRGARNLPDGKLGCFECGRPYGDEYGFPDLMVPNAIWKQISPEGHEGGLLCPSCIARRCDTKGIRCVAMWRSGPFARGDDAVSDLLTQARAEARREALEEAARLAEGHNAATRVIAPRIRALMDQKPE